jgi:predicted nucleic acid-binding protein
VIVVSDTSPLNYLILVDAIDLLPRLFADIHVPPEVIAELSRAGAPEPVRYWADSIPSWLNVSTSSTTLSTSVRLDAGELQALSLAKELGAAAVLIDERKGRRVASEHGMKAIGTLAILELAAEKSLIELGPVLQALRQTTFFISDEYIEAALQRDAARRGK